MTGRRHFHQVTSSSSPGISIPPTSARRWRLPNGLTLIVQEDHSAPVASIQAWCATGSIHEDAQLGAGLSHILEHMLFKGTARRGANAIAQAVQDVGGYINAYTSFDRTVYWIDAPKAGVPTALDVLADAMMHSTLPRDEYAKEQEVIRREFAMGFDDPDRMADQLLFGTAYQVHPYRLPVIGLLDLFDQLGHQQVMEYYKARYVPNNLTFIVAGDVDAAAVREQVTGLFAAEPARPLKPVFVPAEPMQMGRREVHEEFNTELTRLLLAWHIPEITHPDVPALDLLSTIFGNGRSSRLYRRVREQAGLAFGISTFSYTPGDPGIFAIEATTEPDKRNPAQELILQMVDELRQSRVTPEELLKAKKVSLANQIGTLTTVRGQASDLGSNWLFTRNLDFSRDYMEAVQRVTLEDIQRVAQTYFADANSTIVSLNPKGSLARRKTALQTDGAGEIQKFELTNGLRLLVREDARLPIVSIAAVFRGGLLAETRETNGITRLMSKTLLKGTTTRSAEEIAETIESVGGHIGSEAGNNSFNVSLDLTAPDLALGIQLLADILLNATMPQAAVEREKEVQIAAIKDDEEHLTTVARNILREALFREHPYALRTKGSEASVAALDRETLIRFRDEYVVARNAVVSVFGDVKADEVRALFEDALGGLPPGELKLAATKASVPLAETVEVQSTRDKAQGILMVGFRGADIFSADRYALELIDEASSDLGSRFFVRIREEMGLAYFVGAGQMQGLSPGMFMFYLGTDPQKLVPVKTALLDEISKLATRGLTDEELARAKKKLIGQQQIAHQSNDSLGFTCALDELLGLGFDRYKSLEREIGAVTAADIQRVAAEYFLQQPYVLATVRPPEYPADSNKE